MVPYELREGTIFAGDYRVVRPLARGGMGAVYVAEQRSTGKQRALKVMSPMLADLPKARERFVQEAKVGGLIDSVHVVEVIAAGIDEATQMPWLAMELLQGETLQERMQRLGAIPAGELKEIAAQLKHALVLAHTQGIVHRDLKPENLFLERPRRAGVPFTLKILDFGIAKLVQQAKGRQASGTQSLGSPLWMAPEQANAHTIAPATDVWAIGLVAFAAITGRLYWRTAAGDGDLHLTRLLVEILVDPLAPASDRAEELHAKVVPGGAFDRWLDRCLTREPEGRFAEAGACLDALTDVLDGGDFVDTGRDLRAVLPMAPTAMADPAVNPISPTAEADPDVYEPIVRGATEPPTPLTPPASQRSSMGMGQIAALVAGSVLIACMAIFGGLVGFATFAANEDTEVAVASGESPPSRTTSARRGGGDTKMQPIRPTPVNPAAPSPDTASPDTASPDTANPDTTNVAGTTSANAPDPLTGVPDSTGRRSARPLPITRGAAGRALYAGTVGPCWREELTRAAHPRTHLELDVQLSATGMGVQNIRLPGRWHGSPFARCVVARLGQTRFDSPPDDTHIVLNLPGAR